MQPSPQPIVNWPGREIVFFRSRIQTSSAGSPNTAKKAAVGVISLFTTNITRYPQFRRKQSPVGGIQNTLGIGLGLR